MILLSAADGAAINDTESVASSALPVRGSDFATIFWSADDNHNWAIQSSYDNSEWHAIQAGGPNESAPSAADLTETTSPYSVVVHTGGAPFIRINLTCDSGSTDCAFTARGFAGPRSLW